MSDYEKMLDVLSHSDGMFHTAENNNYKVIIIPYPLTGQEVAFYFLRHNGKLNYNTLRCISDD